MMKAIVFDFDGVVVDSEPLHYQAFVDVCQPLGYDFDYRTYLERYIGYDDRDFFRIVLREAMAGAGSPDDDQRIAELCAIKQDAFDRRLEAGAATIPGSVALIREAHAAGLPIAIASGATRRDIDLILTALGLGAVFEVIVSADDVPRSKPHPATYRQAVAALAQQHPDHDLEPASCLAIEDTVAGLTSARDAGLMTLALATTTAHDQLKLAQRIAPNLQDITLATLREWFGG